MVHTLELTSRGLDGKKFKYGRYSLDTLVSAVNILASNDFCRRRMLENSFIVVRVLFRLLQSFHESTVMLRTDESKYAAIELAEKEINAISTLLATDLQVDDELCQRLISRGLASMMISIYERTNPNPPIDEDGPRLLIRLNCWSFGHAGETLPILKTPGSSLKIGSLAHGSVIEVSSKEYFKVVQENDYSKIPIHLRPVQEPPAPHYRLIGGQGFVRCSSADHNFALALTVGSESKSKVREIVKLLLGFDKFDPEDPVNIASREAARLALEENARLYADQFCLFDFTLIKSPFLILFSCVLCQSERRTCIHGGSNSGPRRKNSTV